MVLSRTKLIDWELLMVGIPTASAACRILSPGAAERIVYLYLDAIYLKVRSGGKVVSLPVLVALGVRAGGEKVLLSLATAGAERTAAWEGLLENLGARKMGRPRLVITDGKAGVAPALGRVWPGGGRQRRNGCKTRDRGS